MSFTDANHQPWNPSEPQAKAFHDILEAIFDYADANLEPKRSGLMTREKECMMFEKAGLTDLLEIYSQPNPVLPLIQQYAIMGCAFQLVAAYDPNASPYDFREPDQPGLTKHGWIKFEVISTLLEGNEGNYDILQAYIANFDLQVKNTTEGAFFPGGRYPPLPQRSTVQWYAESLASALGIRRIEEIYQDIRNWIEASQRPQIPVQSYQPTRDLIAEAQQMEFAALEHSNRMLALHRANQAVMQGLKNAASYIV